MNISSGISEITTGTINSIRGPEKTYLWPGYNAGTVRKVSPVTRRETPDFYIIKPSSEERDRIISMSKENFFQEYSKIGSQKRISSVSPGSLFDAIV